MRFMTFVRSDEAHRNYPPPALFAAIAQLGQEATAAGVLLEQGGLLPSQYGAEVHLTGGRIAVHDGPFAESKELVGGYAVYDVRSLDEAKEWSRRFLQAHVDHWPGFDAVVEIRQIAEFSLTSSTADSAVESRRAVEAVWRIESARVVAGLIGMVRDLQLAEDLAQDALVAALQQWPESGVPGNPGAWLTAIAKRRAIDHFRRQDRLERKVVELGHGLAGAADDGQAELDAAAEDHIADDMLRLIFVCCHPVLTLDSRVALTLRMVGGLSTAEIARSFLSTEATIAQRISRAKATIEKAGVPFEVPAPEQRAERLGGVLEVLYLVFNEGYSATAGQDWMRPALCAEAMRLGRLLAGIARGESEVDGLVALMELQASRSPARVGPDGEPILLLDQDRTRWDQLLIRRGLAGLQRALAYGGPAAPYTLQAAIAACHARARRPEDTDWPEIAAIYQALAETAPSPVVELNRAVAVGMAYGPAAGLALLDQLVEAPALRRYHLLPAVRGDLLAKLGRRADAAAEFRRAAELTQNDKERSLLTGRAAALED